jgi:hypothetical protein
MEQQNITLESCGLNLIEATIEVWCFHLSRGGSVQSLCNSPLGQGVLPPTWRLIYGAIKVSPGTIDAQQHVVWLRVYSNQTKKNSVLTKTNRNKICFGCVSVCFVKPKTKNFGCFGLFWCLEPISKQPKQT